MAIAPNNADIRHALGLALVRQHNYAEAIPELRQASELAPDNARYAYVYAIALNSTGSPGQAMELLEHSHKLHPADRDTLLALVSIARETGDFTTALSHARELIALDPEDTEIHRLVLDLEPSALNALAETNNRRDQLTSDLPICLLAKPFERFAQLHHSIDRCVTIKILI